MEKTYASHHLGEAAAEKVRNIREAFSSLHSLIDASSGISDAKLTSLMFLQTAAMWATKAVSHTDPESKVVA